MRSYSFLSLEERAKGHAPCPCGVFTHIFKSEVMRRLPEDYNGERCESCNIWMCRLDKLQPEQPEK